MRFLFIYIGKTNRYCCILQCTYDEASELDMEAMLAALIDGLGGRTSCERWIQPAEARFLPDVGAPPSSNITSHLNQSTIPLIYLSLCIHYISIRQTIYHFVFQNGLSLSFVDFEIQFLLNDYIKKNFSLGEKVFLKKYYSKAFNFCYIIEIKKIKNEDGIFKRFFWAG